MIKLIESNGSYRINEYVVDTPDDIKNLPRDGIMMGSSAIVISTAEVYMLNSANEWVKL